MICSECKTPTYRLQPPSGNPVSTYHCTKCNKIEKVEIKKGKKNI